VCPRKRTSDLRVNEYISRSASRRAFAVRARSRARRSARDHLVWGGPQRNSHAPHATRTNARSRGRSYREISVARFLHFPKKLFVANSARCDLSTAQVLAALFSSLA